MTWVNLFGVQIQFSNMATLKPNAAIVYVALRPNFCSKNTNQIK